MKIKDVKPGNFEKLIDEGYSLDLIYLLSLVEEKYDIDSFKNSKILSLKRTLERKQLISGNSITLSGKELLEVLDEKIPKRLKKIEETSDDFENWWSEYPSTDNFKYKNKVFSGSRGLRVSKEDCKVKFKNIINEGKYSIEDLLSALKREIEAKKEESYKTGENKLKYQVNTLTYLNQKRFENWMDRGEDEINNSVIDI